MKIISYTARVDPETGEVIRPVRSAVRIGETNNWMIQDVDDYDKIPAEANELGALAANVAVPNRNDLHRDHPLYGEKVPMGPFPAGSLPGDIRLMPDNSWQYYDQKTGRWHPWRKTNGRPVDISSPSIELAIGDSKIGLGK